MNTKQIISPKAPVRFPSIITPDTRFDDFGVYRCDLILHPSDPEHAVFLQQVQELAEELGSAALDEQKVSAAKRAQYNLVVPVVDETNQDDELTGNKVVKVKAKAAGQRKDGSTWTYKPRIFNSDGTRYEGGEIWGGSVVQVAVEARGYCMPATRCFGVSLKLQAVLLHEVRVGGGDSAEDFGFAVDHAAAVSAGELDENPF